MAQPLCFGEISLAASERLFCSLSPGDVAPNPAVANKPSRRIKQRQSRNGQVGLAAVASSSRELEVSEWQVSIEGCTMLAPGLSISLELRQLPGRLADFAARGR